MDVENEPFEAEEERTKSQETLLDKLRDALNAQIGTDIGDFVSKEDMKDIVATLNKSDGIFRNNLATIEQSGLPSSELQSYAVRQQRSALIQDGITILTNNGLLRNYEKKV